MFLLYYLEDLLEENPIPDKTNKVFLRTRVFNVSCGRTNEIKLSNLVYDQLYSACSLRDGGFLVSYRNYENSNIKVYMARHDSNFSEVDDKSALHVILISTIII